MEKPRVPTGFPTTPSAWRQFPMHWTAQMHQTMVATIPLEKIQQQRPDFVATGWNTNQKANTTNVTITLRARNGCKDSQHKHFLLRIHFLICKNWKQHRANEGKKCTDMKSFVGEMVRDGNEPKCADVEGCWAKIFDRTQQTGQLEPLWQYTLVSKWCR